MAPSDPNDAPAAPPDETTTKSRAVIQRPREGEHAEGEESPTVDNIEENPDIHDTEAEVDSPITLMARARVSAVAERRAQGEKDDPQATKMIDNGDGEESVLAAREPDAPTREGAELNRQDKEDEELRQAEQGDTRHGKESLALRGEDDPEAERSHEDRTQHDARSNVAAEAEDDGGKTDEAKGKGEATGDTLQPQEDKGVGMGDQTGDHRMDDTNLATNGGDGKNGNGNSMRSGVSPERRSPSDMEGEGEDSQIAEAKGEKINQGVWNEGDGTGNSLGRNGDEMDELDGGGIGGDRKDSDAAGDAAEAEREVGEGMEDKNQGVDNDENGHEKKLDQGGDSMEEHDSGGADANEENNDTAGEAAEAEERGGELTEETDQGGGRNVDDNDRKLERGGDETDESNRGGTGANGTDSDAAEGAAEAERDGGGDVNMERTHNDTVQGKDDNDEAMLDAAQEVGRSTDKKGDEQHQEETSCTDADHEEQEGHGLEARQEDGDEGESERPHQEEDAEMGTEEDSTDGEGNFENEQTDRSDDGSEDNEHSEGEESMPLRHEVGHALGDDDSVMGGLRQPRPPNLADPPPGGDDEVRVVALIAATAEEIVPAEEERFRNDSNVNMDESDVQNNNEEIALAEDAEFSNDHDGDVDEDDAHADSNEQHAAGDVPGSDTGNEETKQSDEELSAGEPGNEDTVEAGKDKRDERLDDSGRTGLTEGGHDDDDLESSEEDRESEHAGGGKEGEIVDLVTSDDEGTLCQSTKQIANKRRCKRPKNYCETERAQGSTKKKSKSNNRSQRTQGSKESSAKSAGGDTKQRKDMTRKLKDRVRTRATSLATALKELEDHVEDEDPDSKTRIQVSVKKMKAMVELTSIMRTDEGHPNDITLDALTHPGSTITRSTTTTGSCGGFAMSRKAKEELANTIFNGKANADAHPALVESVFTILQMSKSVKNTLKDCVAGDILEQLSTAYDSQKRTAKTTSTARTSYSSSEEESIGEESVKHSGKTAEEERGDMKVGRKGESLERSEKPPTTRMDQRDKPPITTMDTKHPPKTPPTCEKGDTEKRCWQAKTTVHMKAWKGEEFDKDKFSHTWAERHCVMERLNSCLDDYVRSTDPSIQNEYLWCAHAEFDWSKWKSNKTSFSATVKVIYAKGDEELTDEHDRQVCQLINLVIDDMGREETLEEIKTAIGTLPWRHKTLEVPTAYTVGSNGTYTTKQIPLTTAMQEYHTTTQKSEWGYSQQYGGDGGEGTITMMLTYVPWDCVPPQTAKGLDSPLNNQGHFVERNNVTEFDLIPHLHSDKTNGTEKLSWYLNDSSLLVNDERPEFYCFGEHTTIMTREEYREDSGGLPTRKIAVVRRTFVQTWHDSMLRPGRRFYHKNIQRSLNEDMAFGFIHTAGESCHECHVMSLGKIKQYAYMDHRDTHRLFVFEDREVLVRYANKKFGLVPAMMLTPTEGGWMKYLAKKGKKKGSLSGRTVACTLAYEMEGFKG